MTSARAKEGACGRLRTDLVHREEKTSAVNCNLLFITCLFAPISIFIPFMNQLYPRLYVLLMHVVLMRVSMHVCVCINMYGCMRCSIHTETNMHNYTSAETDVDIWSLYLWSIFVSIWNIYIHIYIYMSINHIYTYTSAYADTDTKTDSITHARTPIYML